MSCQVSRTFENRARVFETTSGEAIMPRKAVRGQLTWPGAGRTGRNGGRSSLILDP